MTQDRLALIKKEIEKNEDSTRITKEKVKAVKAELLLFSGVQDEEALAEKKVILGKLAGLDKMYNKLRSDYYFLLSEEKQVKVQAQK